MYSRFDFGNGFLVPVRFHENGGGVIAMTAQVAPEVFVGLGCSVGGYAKIKGNVRICGRCTIFGDLLPGDVTVQIEDNALIAGSVDIRGSVLIRDNAQIRGNSKISGSAQILHHARISDNVVIDGDVVVRDQAVIQGHTKITSKGRRIEVRGEYFMKDQNHEYDLHKNKTRKRKPSTLKIVTFYQAIS